MTPAARPAAAPVTAASLGLALHPAAGLASPPFLGYVRGTAPARPSAAATGACLHVITLGFGVRVWWWMADAQHQNRKRLAALVVASGSLAPPRIHPFVHAYTIIDQCIE